MSTNYPNNYDVYASRTDGVDYVMGSHMSNVQDAISAVEQELGLNPKGPYSSIGAAVAAMLDMNIGGTLHGNVFCDSGVTIDGVDISELSGTAKKGSFWSHNAVNRSSLSAGNLPDYLVPGSGLSVDILTTKAGSQVPVEMDVAGYYQKVASPLQSSISPPQPPVTFMPRKAQPTFHYLDTAQLSLSIAHMFRALRHQVSTGWTLQQAK